MPKKGVAAAVSTFVWRAVDAEEGGGSNNVNVEFDNHPEGSNNKAQQPSHP